MATKIASGNLEALLFMYEAARGQCEGAKLAVRN